MRRPSVLLVRLALATVFLVAGAERAFGFTPCAHHEPAAPAAGHHGHGAPGQDQDAHDGLCTCLGACQMAIAGTTPAAKLPGLAAPVALHGIAAMPADEPRPARAPHVLPYSTAPPASR
jgi:hypothetical protein